MQWAYITLGLTQTSMRTPTTTFVAAMLACGCAVAQTQGTKLYDDSPGVSARPRQTIASSNAWPLKKRYADFNEVEKKTVSLTVREHC